MKTLLIIFLFISQLVYSQLIVHDKNDPRLIAYKDSVNSYLYGLKELRVAKMIHDKNDTAIGRYYYISLNKEMKMLNKNIKPLYSLEKYGVLYCLIESNFYIQTCVWHPEIWKKPVIKVIYEKPKKVKKEPLVLKKDTAKSKSITYRYVFRINGKVVTEEEFEKVYGRKVTCDIYDKFNCINNKKNNQ